MCNGVFLFIANNHNDFLGKKKEFYKVFKKVIARQVVWAHVIIISFFFLFLTCCPVFIVIIIDFFLQQLQKNKIE